MIVLCIRRKQHYYILISDDNFQVQTGTDVIQCMMITLMGSQARQFLSVEV